MAQMNPLASVGGRRGWELLKGLEYLPVNPHHPQRRDSIDLKEATPSTRDTTSPARVRKFDPTLLTSKQFIVVAD